jgi:hypothetical protein
VVTDEKGCCKGDFFKIILKFSKKKKNVSFSFFWLFFITDIFMELSDTLGNTKKLMCFKKYLVKIF